MRHHLLIAGTGRSGTTFLVQYLAACGLETQLASGANHFYDEDANAGLEDVLIGQANAPYVCKSPWLFEFVDALLEDRDIAIDAVIIPMRGLVEAATSRVVNELRARGSDDASLWTTWAAVPGGVVYSLNPIDQARVLAMGFHQLLHALVRHQVPVLFLDFPRCVEDAPYLYESLRPVLGDKVDRERALDAHARTAVSGKVRIGGEIADASSDMRQASAPRVQAGEAFPSHESLDRIALLRELGKARRATQHALAQRDAAQAEVGRLRDELQAQAQSLTHCALERERAEARATQAERRRDALEASNSWRVTAPLRSVSDLVRRRTRTR